MIKRQDRKVNRLKRHKRVRVHVAGTPQRPRLAVFRSLNHLYAQVIDDGSSHTVASASTVGLKAKGNGVAQAQEVGKAIAAKAKAAGITSVVFDARTMMFKPDEGVRVKGPCADPAVWPRAGGGYVGVVKRWMEPAGK